jgi:hypothetical protein
MGLTPESIKDWRGESGLDSLRKELGSRFSRKDKAAAMRYFFTSTIALPKSIATPSEHPSRAGQLIRIRC